MKKLFFLSIIILPLIVFAILVFKNQNTNPQKSDAANKSSVISDSNSNSNSLQIGDFTVSWYEITNIKNLKLIPNFSEKLTSSEILTKYNCNFLSNGPFYTKEGSPTGLFISDENTLANWQENPLFDGILSINEMLTPRITRQIPQDKLITAIQTGPILKENGAFQKLTITNDGQSRRVIAGVTGENKLFFLVIYDKNSVFSGPFLALTPDSLKSFEEKSGIKFADAINLDGGAASLFQTQSDSLSEINPSGAFFCQL